jgi:hypothetical protein
MSHLPTRLLLQRTQRVADEACPPYGSIYKQLGISLVVQRRANTAVREIEP